MKKELIQLKKDLDKKIKKASEFADKKNMLIELNLEQAGQLQELLERLFYVKNYNHILDRTELLVLLEEYTDLDRKGKMDEVLESLQKLIFEFFTSKDQWYTEDTFEGVGK